jgi:hypothetical protein
MQTSVMWIAGGIAIAGLAVALIAVAIRFLATDARKHRRDDPEV